MLNKYMDQISLFNEDGITENQPIIGGNSTGIMAINLGKYSKQPWWVNLYRKMGSDFWLPERYSLSSDKKDINLLSVEDLKAYKKILSFLTFLDSIQTVNPPNFANYVSAPDIKLLITFQAFQEAIHSQSYSYIIETIFSGEEKLEIYDMWRSDLFLKKRNKYISSLYQNFIDQPTIRNFIIALIANYILEGLYFYNGFKFFYNLSDRGLMIGSASIIKVINRDEISHLILYENIINAIRSQIGSDFDLLIPEIIETFQTSVQFEEEFSKQALQGCLGFSEKVIEQYTRFLANKRMKAIGIDINPFNEYTENPYKFWDDELEGSQTISTEENLFTSNVTNYNKVDNDSDWNDLEDL